MPLSIDMLASGEPMPRCEKLVETEMGSVLVPFEAFTCMISATIRDLQHECPCLHVYYGSKTEEERMS